MWSQTEPESIQILPSGQPRLSLPERGTGSFLGESQQFTQDQSSKRRFRKRRERRRGVGEVDDRGDATGRQLGESGARRRDERIVVHLKTRGSDTLEPIHKRVPGRDSTGEIGEIEVTVRVDQSGMNEAVGEVEVDIVSPRALQHLDDASARDANRAVAL